MLRVLSFILLANVITPQWRREMIVDCQSLDHGFKTMLTPTFFLVTVYLSPLLSYAYFYIIIS